MTTPWRLQQTADEKFPYRITLEQDGEVTLALRAKVRWPGPGGNVFCLREKEAPGPDEPLEELERVAVTWTSSRSYTSSSPSWPPTRTPRWSSKPPTGISWSQSGLPPGRRRMSPAPASATPPPKSCGRS